VNTPRAEPVAPKPLTEADVRKRFRLQDPERWSQAQTLGFPAPALRRFKPAPLPAVGQVEVRLWQEADLVNWLERFQRVAMLVLSGKS
jgi:hypothetical protein